MRMSCAEHEGNWLVCLCAFVCLHCLLCHRQVPQFVAKENAQAWKSWAPQKPPATSAPQKPPAYGQGSKGGKGKGKMMAAQPMTPKRGAEVLAITDRDAGPVFDYCCSLRVRRIWSACVRRQEDEDRCAMLQLQRVWALLEEVPVPSERIVTSSAVLGS